MALAGVALLGFAQGAELDLLPFMVARYFGMRAYGRVYGLITMGFALATAGGSILFGTAYDRDGSYDSALRIASMCLVASALTFLAMGSYPRLTVPSDTG
jgi:predicted MFS family arabinose efflux permease